MLDATVPGSLTVKSFGECNAQDLTSFVYIDRNEYIEDCLKTHSSLLGDIDIDFEALFLDKLEYEAKDYDYYKDVFDNEYGVVL